jgi:Cof subfamily protein (haloacid dehalogenase superfamily)
VSPSEPEVSFVALDLDGTVLGPDLSISRRTLDAVAEVRARGIPVAIATGRMYRSAARYAVALGLEHPLVCYQGACVRDVPDADGSPGRILYQRPMAAWVGREAITWSRDRGLDPHVNIEDRLIMERGDETAEDYERSSGIGAEFVPDLVAAVRRRPTKVLAVGRAGVPEEVLPAARERFAGRAMVTVSHPEYLEFTAPGVHKGRAVRWLARRLGVKMDRVLAIGDQLNDLELLAAVGYGVAMGGAPDEVSAAARFRTTTWEDEGVARALDALVLGRGSLEMAA